MTRPTYCRHTTPVTILWISSASIRSYYKATVAADANLYKNSTRASLSLLNLQRKIAAVTSTGLEGIKISDFFSKYLYPVISQYKLSFVLFEKNAWNQEKHYFIPVPGHPASEDFIRFVSYPDILTCDDIKK